MKWFYEGDIENSIFVYLNLQSFHMIYAIVCKDQLAAKNGLLPSPSSSFVDSARCFKAIMLLSRQKLSDRRISEFIDRM
jgi:hypothetical protein